MQLSEFSVEQLVTEIENRGSHVCFETSINGTNKALRYVVDEVHPDRVLSSIDDDDIIDYLVSECGKSVVDSRSREVLLHDNHIANVDFRRDDVIEILEHIVNRDGWDKVYTILGPYKVM